MIRRSTRAKYHRAVKWVKAHEKELASERMASALLGNQTRDLWREVKQMSRSSKTLAATVDNACDEASISGVFAAKYQELYNQVSYNDADMTALKDGIESRINDGACTCPFCTNDASVSPVDVQQATRYLNPGKKDAWRWDLLDRSSDPRRSCDSCSSERALHGDDPQRPHTYDDVGLCSCTITQEQ
jgi:hypothetical protein